VDGPTVVHLATHGFFFKSTPTPLVVNGTRGVKLNSTQSTQSTQSPPPPQLTMVVQHSNDDGTFGENPLLLSGVALAGANVPDRAGHEDGLLLALEASTLNLRGTKLVVLSACQTGQGMSSKGEGISGLRRALVLAGSQAQVLSLWNVQDDTTAAFMTKMHAKLAAGVARADAIRDVQLEFLHAPSTAKPFYWAAFFLQGNPASFGGKPPRRLPRDLD